MDFTSLIEKKDKIQAGQNLFRQRIVDILTNEFPDGLTLKELYGAYRVSIDYFFFNSLH